MYKHNSNSVRLRSFSPLEAAECMYVHTIEETEKQVKCIFYLFEAKPMYLKQANARHFVHVYTQCASTSPLPEPPYSLPLHPSPPTVYPYGETGI